MELTREEIEGLASGDMTYPELRDKYSTIGCIPIRKIAQMLLAEMDKPDKWDGAPEWAACAYVYYAEKEEGVPCFTREGVSSFITKIEKAMFRRTVQKTAIVKTEEIDGIADDEINFVLKSNADFFSKTITKKLANALIEERKRSTVWDKAPNQAGIAVVRFIDEKSRVCGIEKYTRPIPKSPVREIAERKARQMFGIPTNTQEDKIADFIEAAINEYKESVK